ncbi:hypothetical protein BDZ89DRAFT_946145, partial [Hymenopellis radicata]
ALCPACGCEVKMGPGGAKNIILTHVNTKNCIKNKEKRLKKEGDARKHGRQQGLTAFLKPRAPKIPAQVTAPTRTSSQPSGPSFDTRLAPLPLSPARISPPALSIPSPQSLPPPNQNSVQTVLARAPTSKLLLALQKKISRVDPASIPATESGYDPLAPFGGDPSAYANPEARGDDLWEDGLNKHVHATFGWGMDVEEAKGLIQNGTEGVNGVLEFMRYFIEERGVSEGLFKEKIELLIKALDTFPVRVVDSDEINSAVLDIQSEYAPPSSSPPTKSSSMKPTSVIDIDTLSDSEIVPISKRPQVVRTPCPGYAPPFPDGASPHKDYPFALHAQHTLPFEYEIRQGVLYVRGLLCRRWLHNKETRCPPCEMLPQNSALAGIMKRIKDGVHDNANLAYNSHSQLVAKYYHRGEQLNVQKLKGLNTEKMLRVRAKALSNHKRLLVAIRSGKVEAVDRIIRIGLKRGMGIKAMLALYERAATGAYRPRSYIEEDYLRGLLLWRLGGNRVAKIAHRSLNQIPGLSTLRRHSTMPRIMPSNGMPTIHEIQKNIDAVLSEEELAASRVSEVVCHQIVMFDEMSIEKRIRWDDKTNFFRGVCREHGEKVSLEFGSVDELKELFRSLDDGKVHYASEATIGALGILTNNRRIYGARPILVSGTCKRENAIKHAQLLETTLTAVNAKKDITKLRVVSIASDGETKRGSALVDITFKRQLSSTSPIHRLLSPLPVMDFFVGDDDLTPDKDYKHVFKRIRNLFLRARGLDVLETHVNPTIMKAHLRDAGGSQEHVESLFKPDDKQDVTLAYQLLRDLWSLPETTSIQPMFVAQRDALRLLGDLFRHLIWPYICVDLSLSEQLKHLSAAAWFTLVLFRKSGKHFIPTLLYTDIMLMIKNVYFCVAKAKIDNPSGMFWIILLGTDRLETIFGILRTIIGTDANVDELQLVERMTGTTEVSNILAIKPEWDSSPRPVDRINPRSWTGDLRLELVNLLTNWTGGRRLVVDKYPQLAPLLDALDRDTRPITILSPLGVLLVDEPLAEDDNEDPDIAPTPDSANPTVPDVPNSSSLPDSPTSPITADNARTLVPTSIRSRANPPTTLSELNECTFDRFVFMDGVKVNKARAIKIQSRYRTQASSTDRLRRVREIARFDVNRPCRPVDADFDESMEDILMCGEPIATVLISEDRLWLCIGAVTDIKNGTGKDSSVTDIELDILSEDGIFIEFQIIDVVPATTDDDQTEKFDWRTRARSKPEVFTVPGQFVQPVHPKLQVPETGSTFWMFASAELIALSADLLQRVNSASDAGVSRRNRIIPSVERTKDFPYREASGM